MKKTFGIVIVIALVLQLFCLGLFTNQASSEQTLEIFALILLGTFVTAPILVAIVSSIARTTHGTALNVVAMVLSFLLHYLLLIAIYIPLTDALLPNEPTLSWAPLLPGFAALAGTFLIAPILGLVTAKVVSGQKPGANGRRKIKKRS